MGRGREGRKKKKGKGGGYGEKEGKRGDIVQSKKLSCVEC